MSPRTRSIARLATWAAPLALAAALPLTTTASGCADSDEIPRSSGGTTTTTTTPPPAGDALPGGAISFFNAAACPEGWTPFAEGAGRIPVATVGDEPSFATQGEPLEDGEDRLHTHEIQAGATLDAVSYAGVAGEANHGVAVQQRVSIAGAAEEASSGLPYVQLLMCKKLGEPRPGSAPIPRGLLMFWNGGTCPEGWSRPIATQGRMLVGVPEGAVPGLSFGGTSLAMGEARAHGHDVGGTLATAPHGIALASGCCADGYAADKAYPYVGASDMTGVGLPTIHLLQCEKM